MVRFGDYGSWRTSTLALALQKGHKLPGMLEHKNWRYTRIWIKLMRGGKRTRAESEAGSHRNKQSKYQWSGPEGVLLMT
jgi:hypothetical protein